MFDEALLDYYKVKTKKKRKPNINDEQEERKQIKILDDMDEFVAEALGSGGGNLHDEEIQGVVEEV